MKKKKNLAVLRTNRKQQKNEEKAKNILYLAHARVAST